MYRKLQWNYFKPKNTVFSTSTAYTPALRHFSFGQLGCQQASVSRL